MAVIYLRNSSSIHWHVPFFVAFYFNKADTALSKLGTAKKHFSRRQISKKPMPHQKMWPISKLWRRNQGHPSWRLHSVLRRWANIVDNNNYECICIHLNRCINSEMYVSHICVQINVSLTGNFVICNLVLGVLSAISRMLLLLRTSITHFRRTISLFFSTPLGEKWHDAVATDNARQNLNSKYFQFWISISAHCAATE